MMLSILKTFGLGLLCTILSPLILLVLALYFVYTILVVAIMYIINIFKYFKGTSILEELEEEKKARLILKGEEEYQAKLREAYLNNITVNPYIPQNSNQEEENSLSNINGGEDND